MTITKAQALNFLGNVKRRQGKGSGKYYAVGVCRILVRKDIVTIEDIVHEFPEVDLLGGEQQTMMGLKSDQDQNLNKKKILQSREQS